MEKLWKRGYEVRIQRVVRPAAQRYLGRPAPRWHQPPIRERWVRGRPGRADQAVRQGYPRPIEFARSFRDEVSASARPFREPIYLRAAGNRRVTRKRHSRVNIGPASAILRHSDAVRTARYAIELFDFATAEHIAVPLPPRATAITLKSDAYRPDASGKFWGFGDSARTRNHRSTKKDRRLMKSAKL